MSFRLRNNGPIWLGEFTALTEAGFSNGCSCRLHGTSSIVPDGFNLALHVGDEAELVNANRRQFAAALGVDAARFTTCAQVHGSKVVCVTEGLIGSGAVDFADTIADTDALITDFHLVDLFLFCLFNKGIVADILDSTLFHCGKQHISRNNDNQYQQIIKI
mgnify:CR=1 FL=1